MCTANPEKSTHPCYTQVSEFPGSHLFFWHFTASWEAVQEVPDREQRTCHQKTLPTLCQRYMNFFSPCLHYNVHSPIYKLLWAISSTVDKPGNITEAAPCICDLCFLLNIKLPRLSTSIFWNGTHGNIWWTGENRSLWPVIHTCPFVSNLSFPATGSGIWAQQLEFQYPRMLYSWGSLDSSHPDTDHPQMQL